MRALTDELSEVTVSEELIAATLRKAGLSTPQNMEENGVLQGGVQDKPLQEKAEGNLSAGSGGSPKKTTKKNLSAFYVRGITFAAAVLILVLISPLPDKACSLPYRCQSQVPSPFPPCPSP